jgi:hypothetical protein
MRTMHQKENSLARYRSNKFVIINYYKPTQERSEKRIIGKPFITGYDKRDGAKEYKLVHSDNDGSLKLYNALLYQPNSCDVTWKSISSFNSTSLKWNNTDFAQSYENFYGCEIDIILSLNDNFVWSRYKTITGKNGKLERTGAFLDLLRIFLNKYNLSYTDERKTGRFDIFIPDSPFKLMQKREDTRNDYDHTSLFGYEYLTFVISHGENFTPYEKLILPFDATTWIMVILTFIIGYLTILILYQFPRYVQQFVFGAFNRDPSMTLAQIFFGMSVVQTPTRNFARFFFIAFSLYCLVIRTAYQGKMFDFLHSYDEKRVPQNLEELIVQKTPVLIRTFYVLKNKAMAESMGLEGDFCKGFICRYL